MTTTTTQTRTATRENGHRPDWIAKTARGYGRNSQLERIGVAWNREDGGIGLRLVGTQVVDGDIYLYPNEAETGDQPA